MKWLNDNRIQVDPPKRPKKMTATRFAAVLGLNRWTTPFNTWCAITRTYEEPFEDTIYTIAGKTIEPKQADYMVDQYWMNNLVRPADIYGEDYFHKTYGDFFHDTKIFGGMWDYLLVDSDKKPTTVLEMKTTKRAEDWLEDIPEYYALQAALYAYLLGVDDVIMVASFLDESDYDHPDKFVCSPENTITRPFKLSERYPLFEQEYINPAKQWWKDHIETGISPEYDEKADADILKVLRTNYPDPDKELKEIIAEAEILKAKIDGQKSIMKPDEDRLKKLTDLIKEKAVSEFRDGDKKVSISGCRYMFEVSKTVTSKVDKKAMEKDGVFNKYVHEEESYRLIQKEIKEEK